MDNTYRPVIKYIFISKYNTEHIIKGYKCEESNTFYRITTLDDKPIDYMKSEYTLKTAEELPPDEPLPVFFGKG